ncbi:hypothetical protein [Shimazuella kribbensis]|uniref:hypothetical protein n=1 Tax=Shimazuella kribbensis TaxID=139808 RepID=UPI0004281B21|nr:hypothetical protein [Shimazuella kribbensis]
MRSLGGRYLFGEGIEQDELKGELWLLRAHKELNSAAIQDLDRIYGPDYRYPYHDAKEYEYEIDMRIEELLDELGN